MNSDDISMQLGIIRSTKGSQAKAAALAQFDSPLMRDILRKTYDTGIAWGISAEAVDALRFTYNADDFVIGAETWGLLDALVLRTLVGRAAVDTIKNHLASLSPESAWVLLGILRKTHSIGMGVTSINKVFPDLIASYPYMRCSLPKDVKFEEWPWTDGVFSQLKADGMYIDISIAADHTATIRSREGQDLTAALPGIALQAILSLMPRLSCQGELLVKRDGKQLDRQSGNGIVNSIVQGGSSAGYTLHASLWDMTSPTYGADVPYERRFGALCELLGTGRGVLCPIESKLVGSMDDAIEHFEEIRARGLEGTILKNPQGFWKNGTSRDQVKMKGVAENTMQVTGFTEGHGMFKGLVGALCCASEDSRVATNVSGFSKDLRVDITNNEAVWLGAYVDVQHNGLILNKNTQLYSLQNARFSKTRIDKSSADVLADFK